MTSLQSVVAAFAIILIDLLGRAILDKVLALSAGPAMVALWAQLQSLVELVGAVTAAGVLQGLTVLISQVRHPYRETALLRAALKLGFSTSLAVALTVVIASNRLVDWLAQEKIAADLFWLAALAGCASTVPATLNAYWLGKHLQKRMVVLTLLSTLVLVLVAVGAWLGSSLRALISFQSIGSVCIGTLVWWYMSRLWKTEGHSENEGDLSRLIRFIPVGVIIGIMSPASMLMVRGLLSTTLSWDDVGFLQALWRSTEWVTAAAAGVLSLVFLPRLGSTYGSDRFRRELIRAAAVVLIPAGLLLLLILLNQRAMLSTLYDPHFVVSNITAAFFVLGCWVRIASWLFLFGLFSAHRTGIIMVGEFLSLPLYAFLLWLFGEGMTLERTALLYLISYLVYFAYMASSLLLSSRSNRVTPDRPGHA